MTTFLLTILVGLVAGVIDILPMLKMKLDKFSIVSAFIFYLIAPFIIFNMGVMNNIWFIKGGIIAFAMAIPVIILVAKEDKKSAIPVTTMSLVLGSLIGIAGHLLNIM